MTTPVSGEPGDDASGRYAPYVIIPRKTVLHHSMGHDLIPALRQIFATVMPSAPCFKMNAF